MTFIFQFIVVFLGILGIWYARMRDRRRIAIYAKYPDGYPCWCEACSVRRLKTAENGK